MDKNISRQPYAAGFRNVGENLIHPIRNIKKYGVADFFRNEIINFGFNPDRMQFLPNYSLHLIGNAMQYVKLAEWYQYHGYPWPRTLSLATTLGYQLLNEALENGSYRGANVDPIADLLIFNPLGLLLFSTDWAKRFFSQTVPIYDWSGQPFINPLNGRMENAGQQYTAQIAVAGSGRLSFLAYWGVQTVIGLSIRRADGHAVSFGSGSVAYDLRYGVNGEGRIVTAVVKPIIGIFYDKNHSLLASVIVSPDAEYLRLEAFPGLLTLNRFPFGVYGARLPKDHWQFGFSLYSLPLGVVFE